MGTLYRRRAGGKYYGEFTDHQGKRQRRTTGTTNKREAQAILAKWEQTANAQRHGLSDEWVPLTELIDAYIAYLKNTSEKHQSDCETRIRRIVDANHWTSADQIEQLGVETTVRNLGRRSDKNQTLSLRSQAHYLTAIKAFTAWLVSPRRALLRDPLQHVKKPNFEADRKLVRRFLLHEEWTWLSKGPNAVLYETAIQTGLRASELRLLRPHHLHKHYLLLQAKETKGRRRAQQFITPELHAQLSNALPFDMPPPLELAQMLRDDLATARQAWEAAKHKKPADFLLPTNAAGSVLDFHSLRHTCGAWLAQAGVNPKVIQTVMRHSTIRLTLDTYGHLMPGAEEDAAAKLGQLLAAHRAAS